MTQKDLITKIIIALKKTLGGGKHYLHEPWFDDSEINYLAKSIKNNSVSTHGNETSVFEDQIRKFTGSKYAFCVINGTSGLHLSLYLSNIKYGDEVLIPALNYVASANATLYLGGTPHFIDVEEKTFGPDTKKLAIYLRKITQVKKGVCYNKITKKKIKALVVTHLFGHPSNLSELVSICKNFRIQLIEDASEGLGSFYKNRHVGTYGKMGILSFNGNKVITTGGGGAILTNSIKIAKKISYIYKNSRENHSWQYKFTELGFNYKMPSINAQLGIAQFKKLNKFLSLKRKLYKKYKIAFSKIDKVTLFKEPQFSQSNYWLQTILLNRSNIKLQKSIIKKTNKEGYGTRPVWNLLNKCNHLRHCPSMNLDSAIDLEKRIINLPSGPRSCIKK